MISKAERTFKIIKKLKQAVETVTNGEGAAF